MKKKKSRKKNLRPFDGRKTLTTDGEVVDISAVIEKYKSLDNPIFLRYQTVYEAPKRSKGNICQPMIRLSGKYLTTFEFNVGDNYEVILEKGKITIVKMVHNSSI